VLRELAPPPSRTKSTVFMGFMLVDDSSWLPALLLEDLPFQS